MRCSSAAAVRCREAHSPATAEDTQNCSLPGQIPPGSQVLIVNSNQEIRQVQGVQWTRFHRAQRQEVGPDRHLLCEWGPTGTSPSTNCSVINTQRSRELEEGKRAAELSAM